MNSYLLESTDSLSLKEEERKIIMENKLEEIVPSIYNLDETPLENALEDLDTYGLFSNQKVIILYHIENLKYDDNKNEFDHLLEYIKNPNPNYLLIIEANKLNNTTKITKELKKICTYTKVELDSKDLIKKELKGYKITPLTISFLIEYCDNDYSKIKNEIDKLKEYKYEEKEITKEDIIELVVKKLGDPRDLTFAFTRSLAERDKKEALKKYHELLSYEIEPLSIIGLLASQIRIIYQVKILENRNLSNKEIAELLGEKSDYRIKKTKELTRYYQEKDLLKLMTQLSDIDLKLKTTDTDPILQIQTFIINL